MFYVYAHRSRLTGEVFYVGKGSGNRACETGNRSECWKRFYRKHGRIVELLRDNMSEAEAYDFEIEAIRGFRAIGQCRANISNGGDGVRVLVRWWGKAISQAQTGKTSPRGMANKNYKNFADKAQLKLDYEQMRLTQIAQKYGVSITLVAMRLQEYGIARRKAGRTATKLKCNEDGLEFDSINAAAKHYGLFRENIRKVLSGKYKTTGKRSFSKI
jgi:hypothetical protein